MLVRTCLPSASPACAGPTNVCCLSMPQNLEAMQEFAAQERLKVLDVVEASGDCTPQDWLTSGSSMDLDDDEKASRK